MSGIVLTFPIKSDKIEGWRRFCQEMSGSRLKMYEASRLRLGVTRERLALVETAFGSAAVTTFEAQDVGQALSQIISSAFPFDIWYREQLQELYGVNLAAYQQYLRPVPLATDPKVHFEWVHELPLIRGVPQVLDAV